MSIKSILIILRNTQVPYYAKGWTLPIMQQYYNVKTIQTIRYENRRILLISMNIQMILQIRQFFYK